jgi:hypothetical protein
MDELTSQESSADCAMAAEQELTKTAHDTDAPPPQHMQPAVATNAKKLHALSKAQWPGKQKAKHARQEVGAPATEAAAAASIFDLTGSSREDQLGQALVLPEAEQQPPASRAAEPQQPELQQEEEGLP